MFCILVVDFSTTNVYILVNFPVVIGGQNDTDKLQLVQKKIRTGKIRSGRKNLVRQLLEKTERTGLLKEGKMKQLELELETPEEIDRTDAWDRWRKPGQTREDYEKEIREAGIKYDGQMQVKRALEARGIRWDPEQHAELDLEWGVHYA